MRDARDRDAAGRRRPATAAWWVRWSWCVVLVLVVLAVLTRDQAPFPGSLDPRNPKASGAQAVARVLADHGVTVTVVRGQDALLDQPVDAHTEVVVTNPGELGPSTLQRLRSHSPRRRRARDDRPGPRPRRPAGPPDRPRPRRVAPRRVPGGAGPPARRTRLRRGGAEGRRLLRCVRHLAPGPQPRVLAADLADVDQQPARAGEGQRRPGPAAPGAARAPALVRRRLRRPRLRGGALALAVAAAVARPERDPPGRRRARADAAARAPAGSAGDRAAAGRGPGGRVDPGARPHLPPHR